MNRRSISGGCILFGSVCLKVWSGLQASALSSAEAELYGLVERAKESLVRRACEHDTDPAGQSMSVSLRTLAVRAATSSSCGVESEVKQRQSKSRPNFKGKNRPLSVHDEVGNPGSQ